MHRVFVYGTLKRGQPNHYRMAEAGQGVARFLGEGTTVDTYPLVVGSKYNNVFLLDTPGKGKNVTGEVYEVDDEMLEIFHRLEDYPLIYTYIPISILPTWDSKPLACNTYVIQNYLPSVLNKPYLSHYDTNELSKQGLGFVLPSARPPTAPQNRLDHWRAVKHFPSDA